MWLKVFVTEFIVIFIINAFTIIVFARNRHIRKRSTYLIINVTVADLLVGTVAGPLRIYQSLKMEPGHAFVWKYFIVLTLKNTFSASSLDNLVLIALERLHATLCPLRHCLIEKGAYYKVIICSLLLALLFASVVAVLYEYEPVAILYLWTSHIILALLILITSYIIIMVKVKNDPRPRHFGSVISDRKLSETLFIVTVVSILTILPWAICAVIPVGVWNQKAHSPIRYTVYALYYASSLVNPLIYAMRMQGFRKAAKKLFCKKTIRSTRVHNIELYAL